MAPPVVVEQDEVSRGGNDLIWLPISRQDGRMIHGHDNPVALSPQFCATPLAATGRVDLVDALHWIAEDRSLVDGADVSGILTALVAAADAGVQGSESALLAAVRAALRSTLDTSVDLLLTGSVVSPHRNQAALANVARRTPTGSLADITSTAVLAAQADDSLVVETLGLVAGLSWRDLQARSQAASSMALWPLGQWRCSWTVLSVVARSRSCEPAG